MWKSLSKLWPLLAKHAYIPPISSHQMSPTLLFTSNVSLGESRGGEEKGEGDMFGVLATSYTGGGPVQPGTVY